MRFDPAKHRRRSVRLRGYDYAQSGYYFVTLCARARECLFGEIADGEMRLNQLGHIVADEWTRSSTIRAEIELDAWVVMPNHLHGIVVITRDDSAKQPKVGTHGRAPLRRAPRSLSSFVAGFKSATTKRINVIRETPGVPVWQRNYYDHVIREERVLVTIRRYIEVNPLLWEYDVENTARDAPATVGAHGRAPEIASALAHQWGLPADELSFLGIAPSRSVSNGEKRAR